MGTYCPNCDGLAKSLGTVRQVPFYVCLHCGTEFKASELDDRADEAYDDWVAEQQEQLNNEIE